MPPVEKLEWTIFRVTVAMQMHNSTPASSVFCVVDDPGDFPEGAEIGLHCRLLGEKEVNPASSPLAVPVSDCRFRE